MRKLIFTLPFLFFFISTSYTQNWGTWGNPHDCADGLDWRIKRTDIEFSGKTKWEIEFRNKYREKIYFSFGCSESAENIKVDERYGCKSGEIIKSFTFIPSQKNRVYILVKDIRFGEKDYSSPYWVCKNGILVLDDSEEKRKQKAEEERNNRIEESKRKAQEQEEEIKQQAKEERENRELGKYESLVERADEFYEDGNYSAAIDKYDEAIEYNKSKGNKYGSNSYAINRKKSMLAKKQENEKLAKGIYEEATNVSILADFGNNDYDESVRKYEEAIENLEEARRLNPNDREKIDRLINNLQKQKSNKEYQKQQSELLEEKQELMRDVFSEVQRRQTEKFEEKERERERKRQREDELFEIRRDEEPTKYREALSLGTKSAYQDYLSKYGIYNTRHRDDIKSKIFLILKEEGKVSEVLTKLPKYEQYISEAPERIQRKNNINAALGWTIVGLSVPTGLIVVDALTDGGIDGEIFGELDVGVSTHEKIAIGTVGSAVIILAIMGINELGIKSIKKKSDKYSKSIRAMDFSINTRIGKNSLGAGIVLTF